MKKLIFLFTMVLAVSMAMAQNKSTVEQIGLGENNATVSQLGKHNKALVMQSNDVMVEVNNATTYQEGNNNYARIRQINSNTEPGTPLQTLNAKQTQFGTENYADIYQEMGRWGTINAEQYQEGNDNWARIRQEKDAHSNAKQTQVGDNNWTKIFQDYESYANAEVIQRGNLNKSLVSQAGGNYQTAYNYQEGFRSYSNIDQDGIRRWGDERDEARNNATVHQFGAAGTGGLDFVNISNVSQIGGQNNATVNQTWQ